MEIGTKGQFFVLVIVFVVSVIIGLAYFTTESKQLVHQAETEQDSNVHNMLTNYENILKESLAGGFHKGNQTFYQEVQQEIETHAKEKGYSLTTQCQNTTVNNYTSILECNLSLTVENNIVTKNFSYTHEVPFEIVMYSDTNLTNEADTFTASDTVYYRVTTNNNSATVNMTSYFPNGTMHHTEDKTPANFSVNGSFVVNAFGPSGNWEITANNTIDNTVKDLWIS